MRIEEYTNQLTAAQRKAQVQRWLAAATGGTRPRPNYQFELNHAGLLVVDMNRYFTHPKGPRYLPASKDATENIEGLLAMWRGAGRPVWFARHGHRDAADAGMFAKFFNGFIEADSPDAQIIPSVRPLTSESIVDKNSYDAFLHTPLEEQLRNEAISQLIVCGVLTHMCVETTVRSAFCRGFEVYLPVDATAADNEPNHVNALHSMAQTAAVMRTTAQLLHEGSTGSPGVQ